MARRARRAGILSLPLHGTNSTCSGHFSMWNTSDFAGPSGSPQGGAAASLQKVFGPPDAPDELGTLAHYRVLKPLGEGGMGAVFLARDPQLDRTIALKVMRPELASDATARERFLREARAVAAVKNDHVITIYQVGQHNDVPFLA